MQALAALMLVDSSAADDLANALGMPLVERYFVMVIRIPDLTIAADDERREKVVEAVLAHRRVAIIWEATDELVVLVPSGGASTPRILEVAERSALRLVHEFAKLIELPCAVGAATGPIGGLAEAVALARCVSRAAPVEALPRRVHVMHDVFVELGVKQLPEVELWMRELTQRLTAGPDLVVTLDTYYQNDMNRLNTASALFIHPRTLDYRLQRVRELVGIDPRSTRGVRILSAVVARVLAGT